MAFASSVLVMPVSEWSTSGVSIFSTGAFVSTGVGVSLAGCEALCCSAGADASVLDAQPVTNATEPILAATLRAMFLRKVFSIEDDRSCVVFIATP
jgi:hypothetical protein